MSDVPGTLTIFPRTPLSGRDGPRCRAIVPAARGGWSEPVLSEGELSAEAWTDKHPHTESNFVIEGKMFVKSGGTAIEAHEGDVIRVSGDTVAKYWAPKYARLLAIYGPSTGGSAELLGYEKLSSKSL